MAQHKVARVVKHKGFWIKDEHGNRVMVPKGETVMVSPQAAEAFKDRLVDPKVLEAEAAAAKAAAEAAEAAAKAAEAAKIGATANNSNDADKAQGDSQQGGGDNKPSPSKQLKN